MEKMSLHQRNTEIIRRSNAGAPHRTIAMQFGLSISRIQQIVNRFRAEEERQERSSRLIGNLRKFDNVDRNWPTETLIQDLRFPVRAEQRLIEYFGCSNRNEISLKDIMDFLIADYEEIPHDLYEACPALKQKHVGRKTYYAFVNHLSELDLGHAFGCEWNKRLKKLIHFMRKAEGYIPDLLRQYDI